MTSAAFCGVSTSTAANFKSLRDLPKPGGGGEVHGGAGVSLVCQPHDGAPREHFPDEEGGFPFIVGTAVFRLFLPTFQILDESCLLSGKLPPSRMDTGFLCGIADHGLPSRLVSKAHQEGRKYMRLSTNVAGAQLSTQSSW